MEPALSAATARVFPLVGPGHPLERGLEAFRARMASDPRLAGRPAESEMKALPRSDGSWAIDRLYSFVPRAGGSRFGGAMLHAGAGSVTRPEVHEFPHDPRLPFMSAPGSPLLARAGASVLRYVPLRRLTFRVEIGAGRALIGKFKRPSTLAGSYRRLASASIAAERSGAGLVVPRPAGIDAERSVFFQEQAPGTDASALADPARLADVMSTVGRVHREVHALPVRDVPRWDFGAFRAGIDRDLAWIAFMVDGSAARLRRVGARLAACVPDPAAAPDAFCHGDFVMSQLLIDGEGVSVLDFDLAAIGDPSRDVAMLMASLPFDVPYLATAGTAELERARAAYLAGYEERAGAALDARRLQWHRVCAAIYHVAMRIKKGRSDRAEVDRSLDELDELCGELR